jgi:hypothetical protein
MTRGHADGELTATRPVLIADAAASEVVVYQFRIWLREISPMIWRRVLLRSDQTLADLHYALQISFGWTDFHLHRFALHGKEYGIPRRGGPWYTANARHVRLADLHLRHRERFVYEYDFGDSWVHEIRLEQTVALGARHTYPRCIGGARAGPPEDCGGPWAYLALRQHYSPFRIAERLVDLLDDRDRDDGEEELVTLRYWLKCDRFDRRAVNRRLQLYAAGDDGWQAG